MPKGKHGTNAITLLKEDHRKVKDLFDQFEDSEDSQEKMKIAQEALQELKIHAAIEEEIFYPTVREAMKEDEQSIMEEAEQEHHVAKVLIAELDQLKEMDEIYEAKFIVLAENVRHHIKEEEGEMLPEAKKTDADMEGLGEQMMQRKQELQERGVPATEEESMVSRK
jgi:hemerythrin-like domain-containing protein